MNFALGKVSEFKKKLNPLLYKAFYCDQNELPIYCLSKFIIS